MQPNTTFPSLMALLAAAGLSACQGGVHPSGVNNLSPNEKNASAQDPCDGFACPDLQVCVLVTLQEPCGADTPRGEQCMAPVFVEPMCEWEDPCSYTRCPAGTHCEAHFGAGFSGQSEGPPQAVCVDDPISCEQDSQCPTGLVCHVYCHQAGDVSVSGNSECTEPPCEEICVGVCGEPYPVHVDPCEGFACPAGMYCTVLGNAGNVGGNLEDPVPVCLEEAPLCETDADCPDSMECPAPLDDVDVRGQLSCQYRNPCHTVDCAEGKECIMEFVACEVWPCVPQALCIDLPEPVTGERCGDTQCADGLVCCNPLQAICALPGEPCIQ